MIMSLSSNPYMQGAGHVMGKIIPDLKKGEIDTEKIEKQLLDKLEKSSDDDGFDVIVQFKPKTEELTPSKNTDIIKSAVSRYQKPFIEFLKKSGAKNTETLWIINGLNTDIPKSLIMELTRFKDTKIITENRPVNPLC